jgi:poly-gamma-glutamate synthesis protein (capsule biosynthesis protein)
MHPDNLPALTAIRPDVCVLANNHILDFGRRGLADTCDALAAAEIHGVGAGANLEAAQRLAVIIGSVATNPVGFPNRGRRTATGPGVC